MLMTWRSKSEQSHLQNSQSKTCLNLGNHQNKILLVVSFRKTSHPFLGYIVSTPLLICIHLPYCFSLPKLFLTFIPIAVATLSLISSPFKTCRQTFLLFAQGIQCPLRFCQGDTTQHLTRPAGAVNWGGSGDLGSARYSNKTNTPPEH